MIGLSLISNFFQFRLSRSPKHGPTCVVTAVLHVAQVNIPVDLVVKMDDEEVVRVL